jgi:hypothetical protein
MFIAAGGGAGGLKGGFRLPARRQFFLRCTVEMKDGKYESLEEFAVRASKELRKSFIEDLRITTLNGRTVTHETIKSNAMRGSKPYSFYFVDHVTGALSQFLDTKDIEEIGGLLDKYHLDTDILFPAFWVSSKQYINISPLTYVLTNREDDFDKVADYLIRRGANVNLLQEVISLQKVNNNGKDTNADNNNDYKNNADIPYYDLTPLMVVVFREKYRAVKYLIEHGAKVKVGDLDAFELAKDILPDKHRIVRYLDEYTKDITSRGRTVQAVHNVFSRKRPRGEKGRELPHLPPDVIGHIADLLVNKKGHTEKILANLKTKYGYSGGSRKRRATRRRA